MSYEQEMIQQFRRDPRSYIWSLVDEGAIEADVLLSILLDWCSQDDLRRACEVNDMHPSVLFDEEDEDETEDEEQDDLEADVDDSR